MSGDLKYTITLYCIYHRWIKCNVPFTVIEKANVLKQPQTLYFDLLHDHIPDKFLIKDINANGLGLFQLILNNLRICVRLSRGLWMLLHHLQAQNVDLPPDETGLRVLTNWRLNVGLTCYTFKDKKLSLKTEQRCHYLYATFLGTGLCVKNYL